MIFPSEVRPVGARPVSYPSDMAQLEQLADAAIRKADREQSWPARVTKIRGLICVDAIEDTILNYQEAGWRVGRPPDDCYFVIDRPVSP